MLPVLQVRSSSAVCVDWFQFFEFCGGILRILEKLRILCAGVKHVAGDMFKNVPSGDAIFMKVSNSASYLGCNLGYVAMFHLLGRAMNEP